MSLLDWIAQQLTAWPLWLQLPAVLLVLMPVAGVLAWVLLRLIDLTALYLNRWFNPDVD
ncbi:MAG TPA: hypothetical protein VFC72_04865 [Corynebacterium sp.]|nr:hypothetical protein [Corynebacterium sp.]